MPRVPKPDSAESSQSMERSAGHDGSHTVLAGQVGMPSPSASKQHDEVVNGAK